jgi:predicted NBD/HSP70 family sugar kinase
VPPLERATTAARPAMVRQANLRSVLEIFRADSPLMASDIIERTGLSRASVHAVCDELIQRGLVRELAQTPPSAANGMGRPSRTYDFHARAGFIIAVDLSPRTVRTLLCDLRGDVIAGESHTGPEMRPADVVVAEAVRLVGKMLAETGIAPSNVLAVAVGVPAPVGNSGKVLRPNVALPEIESVDLVGAFRGPDGWDVLVENDGNLGILGERWRGVAQASDHAVMILAGERLGAGIVENGRLVRGYDGSAGEMDFLDLLDGVGDTRGVGNIARELGDLAVAKVRADPTTSEDAPGALLAREAGDAEHVTSEHVLRAAVAGDPTAVEIVDTIAERMARTVAVISTLLNPQLIVLGGAVADAGDALLDPIRSRLPRYTRSPARLAASSLGDVIVATGAARLALDHAVAKLLA